MPTPPKFLEGRKTDPGVTNIRDPASPHWRPWLGVENRCLVPFTSFAEPDNGTFGGRAPVWFAFDETRPSHASPVSGPDGPQFAMRS
jgi:putative SOS response-associated peptidase YedK